MSEKIVPVTVRILDKDFQVACPPEQEEGLRESARILDRNMREIRDGSRIAGTDRIAIIAALNLAHELLQTRQQGGGLDEDAQLRIKTMQEKLQSALYRNRQMEL